MKSRLGALSWILLVVAGLVMGCASPEESYALMEIGWADSMEGAEAESRESGKPLVAVFYVDWGEETASAKFRNETLEAPAVKRFSADFVWVEVDGEARKGMARKYEVKSYPTVIVLRADGLEVGRLDRYKGAEETAEFLEGCLDKAG